MSVAKRWLWRVLVIWVVMGASLHGQVIPERSFYRFDPNKAPVVNVEVINAYANKTVRVETESTRITTPGEKNEQPTKDGALLVSPKAFTLPPNSRRTVRLLLRERPTSGESVYRVAFAPRSATAEDPSQEEAPSKGMRLSVLIGGGILVFAPADQLRGEIKWQRHENAVRFTNTGTVNGFISVTKICNQKGEDCYVPNTHSGGRLYVGKELTLPAGANTELLVESLENLGEKFTLKSTDNEGIITFTP